MAIQTNKEELFKLYGEKIKQPLFDDLVLIVLGGEKGVIAEYFEKNIKFSKLIVIEPITTLGNNSQTRNNYKNFYQRNNGKILHINLKKIEEAPDKFIQLLLKNKIIENGLEIIKNPFYEIHYKNELEKVLQQIEGILTHIKPITKMAITTDLIDESQAKYKLSEQSNLNNQFTEELEKIKKGKLVILFGFENGNILKNLIKRINSFNIAIVEPVKHTLKDNQIEFLEEIKSITSSSYDYFQFEKGKDERLKFFDYISKKVVFLDDIEIIINPRYINNYYKETYETVKLAKDIIADVNSLRGNSISDEMYGIMNSLYNLRKIKDLKLVPGSLNIKNIITVAAGPSIDEHLEELKALSKKFVVIAVEVVVEKLLKNGIFPDIICSQERTLTVYSDYINTFSDEIKEKSIYITPTLLHTYNLDEMKNTVLVSQTTKSASESYMYDHYYNFSKPISPSIHAGLFAISASLLFNPENIIIFGHDVSVPISKKSHAEDIKANNYYKEDSEIIIGNRGQKVFLPPLLKRYFNNTENITLRIKKEKNVNFYNFSDGAKLTAFTDSNNAIYNKLLQEKDEKKNILDHLQIATEKNKEEILKRLEFEKETLELQTEFLKDLDNLNKFTINTKFFDLILNNPTLLAQGARFLLQEFMAKHFFYKEEMENWIIQNSEEIFNIALMMKEIVLNTINLIKKEEQLPLYTSDDIKKLYKFYFYAVIRDKFLNKDFELKRELTNEEYNYLLESFLHTFQPLNYIYFLRLLLNYKEQFNMTEENGQLYRKGIKRCIDFFYTKWITLEQDKESEEGIFIRERIVSLLYEAGRYEELISFVNQHTNPTIFEFELLADTYNEIGQFESSFYLYKELIKNKKYNDKVLLNLLNNLVFSNKFAESLYFAKILEENFKNNSVYIANMNHLNNNIQAFQSKNTKSSLNLLESNPTNNECIRFPSKLHSQEELDTIIELLAKQQEVQFSKHEDIYYFDKTPDTSFFIDDILINNQKGDL